MKKEDLRIAIALSGGGVRAAVFHLGVLARLAQDNLLEQITYLSTVSGGSLVTGLIYSIAARRWPTSAVYLDECLPRCFYYLTKTKLQLNYSLRAIARYLILSPGKAKNLSDSLKSQWDISGTLQDIPRDPRWLINATPYESGKNWRFEKERMGDYTLNYVDNPRFPIADAIAASAGFPVLIGSLEMETRGHAWFKYGKDDKHEPTTQPLQTINLWDGGVYDNVGLRALCTLDKEFKFKKGYNFLIASDACKSIEIEEGSSIMRIIEIMMSQVSGLWSQIVVNHFKNNKYTGVYLKIGNTAREIFEDAKYPKDKAELYMRTAQGEKEVQGAANFETTLKKMTEEEFFLLFRHGWEVADYTLIAYCPNLFDHREYKRPRRFDSR